ncbi:AMP-binding protein [Prescottella defluvii]|nr:AMP-binding protein [Prescottella defluvii]
MYGITETCVHVTHDPLSPESITGAPVGSIGTPVPGLAVRVLDLRLHPVPPGVTGELYVTGAQLSRGYLDRPELTSARFVADPFDPGGRMYRTGDLGMWTAEGTLRFAGRSDFQVQIRGYRVELGEVESALTAAPGVASAVAVADEGPVGTRILGYAVPESPSVDPDAVRESVAQLLPSYMVPSAVVVLDRVPTTVHGKLDRAALPLPDAEGRPRGAPGTPIEEAVAATVGELLGLDHVGRSDDFFALGGNSLVAAQLAARIGDVLGVGLGVRDVFDEPTVAGLARRATATGEAARPPLVARQRPERIPLSPSQQRIWFINQFDTASPAYNISVSVRLSGRLDEGALRAALADVVDRHESLRTIYPLDDAGPRQEVLPTGAEGAVPDVVDVENESELLPRMHAVMAGDST